MENYISKGTWENSVHYLNLGFCHFISLTLFVHFGFGNTFKIKYVFAGNLAIGRINPKNEYSTIISIYQENVYINYKYNLKARVYQ